MLTPAKNLTHVITVSTIAELVKALQDMAIVANVLSDRKMTADEVYIMDGSMTVQLIEKTLSDGSNVYDVDIQRVEEA